MSEISRPARPDRFVVESEGRKIGVAVRKRGGFEFLSSHADFAPLDRRVFPRARSLVLEVTRHANQIRRAEPFALRRATGLW